MSKLRRSMLFVPSSNAAMLSNSFIYTPPDAIMFDLEDSVSIREKDTARMLVFNALQHPLYKEIETVVRVNSLDSKYGHDDVKAVVKAGGLMSCALLKRIPFKMLLIWKMPSQMLKSSLDEK